LTVVLTRDAPLYRCRPAKAIILTIGYRPIVKKEFIYQIINWVEKILSLKGGKIL